MSEIMKEIGVPIERRTPDPAYTGPEYRVVGELRSVGQAPGDEVGPYTVDDGEIPFFRRQVMAWGAWPDPSHPAVLYSNRGQGVTMSTSQALTLLKKHAVGFGIAGLLVGAAGGYLLGRKR